MGGLERTLTDKANYLVANGHDVMFLTYAQGENKVFYDLDSRVRQVDVDCSIYVIYNSPFWNRIKRYLQLRRQFRERMTRVLDDFRPDVVVVTIPNTEDFILDIVTVAHAKNVKVIVESHLAFPFHLKNKQLTERILFKLYPPLKAIRQVDLLIALTEQDADNFRRHKVPQVTVVPNPSTYYCDDIGAVEKQEGRIIAVGRLSNQKRYDRLIHAFSLIASKYPAWSVDIFGAGPLENSIQMLIERQGLTGRVRLNKPTQDIIDEYKRSQFFVLSSDYEGFGLVIIEAMACGLPVVSTTCPCGPSEIITDGGNGLLARMDESDLAKKMEWLITHEAERRQMGLCAHETSARYRKELVMPEWEQTYLSVIG